MNIMFLIRAIGYGGGAERQLAVLAKGLKQKGHQVSVVVLYGGGDLEPELEKNGVKIYDLKKKGFWDLTGFLKRYSELLKEIQPDILHGYITMQNILSSLARFYTPKTKVVWGLRDSNIGVGNLPLSVRIIFKLSCLVSSKTDLIISNSQAGKDFHIKQGYPEALIQVVQNGIDTDLFQRNPDSRIALRSAWSIKNEQIVVGKVARLDRKKDHVTFFYACAIVNRKFPDIKFVYAGEDSPNYRKELEFLAKELGIDNNLIWAGMHTDMPALYSALDIAVSASLYEGFPNVVAEAMSCNLPVIATDVGDVSQMIEGIGICVAPADPQALAEGIINVLGSDLFAIGKLGRERIIDRYSVAALVNKTEALLMAL